MARISTICPHCRRIVPANKVCECRPKRTTAELIEAQPWRMVYRLPSYRRNRAARYRLAGGKCESCGTPIRGDIHPEGATWECDHVVEARHFRVLDDANAIENLRCKCVPCHRAKTNAAR